MDATSDELHDLFEELLAASEPVIELDPAQREAWASGLLATWRGELSGDEAAAVDKDFYAYCVAAKSEVGDIVARSVAAIDPQRVSEVKDVWRPVGAWQVVRGERPPAFSSSATAQESGSFIVGFERDEVEHSMLAEVADGLLVDLIFGPTPSEVVPDADVVWEEMGQRISVVEIDPAAAAEIIIAAWQSAAAEPIVDAPPGLIMNQIVALARLHTVLGDDRPDLPPLTEKPDAALSFTEGMDDSEVAEANAWASGVLRSALRRSIEPTVTPSDGLVAATAQPLRGPIDQLDIDEQRALVFLEWADWLGVVIGLCRAGPGVVVTPKALVDMVNKCPEVSTSVPAADRDYVEAAFSVAIRLWDRAGVVIDSALSPEGHAAIAPAAFSAWS